jgi:hypothetical protein
MQVSIGTVVTLRSTVDEQTESYSILARGTVIRTRNHQLPGSDCAGDPRQEGR